MKLSRVLGKLAFAATIALASVSTSWAQSPDSRAGKNAPGNEQHKGMMGMGAMCPMEVQGASVTTEDLKDGVALVFTTRTGDVADLRQRVRHMAQMHNQHPEGGMMGSCPHHQGGTGGSGMGGMMKGGTMMPPATTTVQEIDGGARLVFKPKDASQLAALRQHVQMCAQGMASGECPMMAPETEPAPTAPPSTD